MPPVAGRATCRVAAVVVVSRAPVVNFVVRFLLAAVLAALAGIPAPASPLVARFSTLAGDFDVLLNAEAAPVTVANFVRYAQGGTYDDTIIHRSTTYNPGNIQIIQGGSFYIEGFTIFEVPLFDPIPLETNLPNLRGTIAMARRAAPDTATSGWFFNLADDPRLDPGPFGLGYAVFGRVLGSGMDNVVDLLGSVTSYDASAMLGDQFSELPLLEPVIRPDTFLYLFQVDVVPFRVTDIRRDASGCRVEWTPLSTNTPVNVERSTDLAAGGWTVVSSNNTTGVFTDPAPPAGAAFYRAVLP